MIISRQMEQPVNYQVGCMIGYGNSFVRSFAGAGFIGQREVAKHFGAAISLEREQLIPREHRERQNVGRLVLGPPFAVEGVNFRVDGEQQAGC